MADVCVHKLNLTFYLILMGGIFKGCLVFFFFSKLTVLEECCGNEEYLLKICPLWCFYYYIPCERSLAHSKQRKYKYSTKPLWAYHMVYLLGRRIPPYTHVYLPFTQMENLWMDIGRELIPSLVNIFLQWNYNKTAAGSFGVTPLLVATTPLRNCLPDELHTSQHFKSST